MTPHRRVRDTTDFEPALWRFGYIHPQNGLYVPFDISGFGSFTSRKRFDDVIHSNQRFKPAVSEFQRYSAGITSGSWSNSDGATLYRVSGTPPFTHPDLLSGGSFLPLASSGAIALAVDNAYLAMSKQVPVEVNILNFAYELRELGDLVPTLAESFSRTVSGQYLNWQFGVKPLLADLRSLGSILSKVEDRLAYLRTTWGKRTRVGHSEDLNVEIWESPRVISDFTALTGLKFEATPISYRSRFTASGYIYHTLQRLYGIESTLRGASAALGLLNPSEAVWNAIPFSFVADWFGRIGNVVSRLDTLQPFPGEWHCIDFGYSVKEYIKVKLDIIWANSNVKIGIGTVEQTRYQRYLGLPVNPTQLIGSGSLTSSQQLLGVALLNSTRKH